MNAAQIEGLQLFRPQVNADRRGSLDVSRQWIAMPMAQWNVVRSAPGVLRGVHVHSRYDEVYTALTGRMLIALKDARAAHRPLARRCCNGSTTAWTMSSSWCRPGSRMASFSKPAVS